MNPPIQLEGQPLSDLQEYNQRLKENTKAIYIVGVCILLFILWIIIAIWFMIDYFNLIDYIAFKFNGGC